MNNTSSNNTALVSRESFDSGEPRALLDSNHETVHALLQADLTAEEIGEDALRSHFVDQYLGQMQNGGFSQFVYNLQWHPLIVSYVEEGLKAMGALAHHSLFEEGKHHVEALGDDLEAFLSSEYFGDNPLRDRLNVINERFFSLAALENLERLNADWLRSLPGLRLVSCDQMSDALASRIAEALTHPDQQHP